MYTNDCCEAMPGRLDDRKTECSMPTMPTVEKMHCLRDASVNLMMMAQDLNRFLFGSDETLEKRESCNCFDGEIDITFENLKDTAHVLQEIMGRLGL